MSQDLPNIFSITVHFESERIGKKPMCSQTETHRSVIFSYFQNTHEWVGEAIFKEFNTAFSSVYT